MIVKKILTVSHVDVIRDGEKVCNSLELVKDDVILLRRRTDSSGTIFGWRVDVNESLLTGESDSIHKTCGSKRCCREAL